MQIRLVDVPDLNYFSTDKPFPRGEIEVQTLTMITGYFRNKDATDKSFTDDGWFRTGDIGQQESPTIVRIIDRVKNVFKLAQGEFVAAEGLEIQFMESAFLNQIYIHCDSTKSYLTCVVVPSKQVLLQVALVSSLCLCSHVLRAISTAQCVLIWTMQMCFSDLRVVFAVGGYPARSGRARHGT